MVLSIVLIVAMLSAEISVFFIDSLILSNYFKSFYFYWIFTILVGMRTPSDYGIGLSESATENFFVTFDLAANYFYFKISRPFNLPFSVVRCASETVLWILL